LTKNSNKIFTIKEQTLFSINESEKKKIIQDYQNKIDINWRKIVMPEDTIVLAGDISWGMSLQQSYDDFRFINNLPGKKIILKGNHDYWWSSKKKMDDFFSSNCLSTINILHNNHYQFDNYGICGTRGWVNMPDEISDAKVLKREAQRLDVSIKSAIDSGLEPIVFMHYPPIFANNFNYDILEVMYKYKIKKCFYGHIHGSKGHSLAPIGEYDDIQFTLISGDYLQFFPYKVL